eukprot:UN34329
MLSPSEKTPESIKLNTILDQSEETVSPFKDLKFEAERKNTSTHSLKAGADDCMPPENDTLTKFPSEKSSANSLSFPIEALTMSAEPSHAHDGEDPRSMMYLEKFNDKGRFRKTPYEIEKEIFKVVFGETQPTPYFFYIYILIASPLLLTITLAVKPCNDLYDCDPVLT